MKYSLILLCLFITGAARAELDPFSVYSLHAPNGCLDAEIGTKKLTLADLIEIGLCNNPSLNKGFMSVKASEASYGATQSEYLPTISATGSLSSDYSKGEYDGSSHGDPYSGNTQPRTHDLPPEQRYALRRQQIRQTHAHKPHGDDRDHH